MKILFILVLLINVIYLGFELDKETRIQHISEPKIPYLQTHEQLQLLTQDKRKLLKRNNDGIIDLAKIESDDESAEQGTLGLSATEIAIEASDSDQKLLDMLEIDLTQKQRIDETDSSDAVCFSFGPFDQIERAEELIDWLDQHSYRFTERWKFENDKQLFWVYLAPVAERTQALATLEQLQAQGVQDYRLIRKGTFKNAISLGLFSSQARVNRRLSELNSKGYRPVAVPYDSEDSNRVLWLDVKISNLKGSFQPDYYQLFARFNSLPLDCGQIDMAAAKP